MNLCFIVDSHEDAKMGLFYAAYNRMNKFQEHGHEVKVFSVRKYHSVFLRVVRRLLGAEVKERKEDSFVHSHLTYNCVWYKETLVSYLLEKLSFPYLYYKSYARQIKNQVGSADIVVAHWGLECGLFAMELAKSIHKPFVVYYHGSDIHSTPACWRSVLQRIMNTADANIFVSRQLLDCAIQIYGKIRNPLIVYNGYDSKVFYPRSKELIEKSKSRYGLCGRKVVGFVGNLELVKRAEVLPEIFTEIESLSETPIVFLVIGDGSLRNNVEQRCHNTIFFGKLPNMEVAELMNTMDVLILPSRKEGFALVIVEALACGSNCVASSVGGNPEILSSEYLVDMNEENSIERFAKKVCDVLKGKIISQQNNTCYSWEDIYRLESGLLTKIADK